MSESWDEYRVLYEFDYDRGWAPAPVHDWGSRSTTLTNFLEGISRMTKGAPGMYRNVRVEKRTLTATSWEQVAEVTDVAASA